MARLHKVNDPASYIRNAAADLISEHGIEKFSVRVLAKKVKYSHGTVFKYFANSDELIIQINTQTIEKLYYVLSAMNSHPKSGVEKLIYASQKYLEFVEQNQYLWDSIMSYNRKGSKKVSRQYDMQLDRLMSLVSDMVKPNISAGQNVYIMTNLLWAGLQGIYQISKRKSINLSLAIKPKKLAENLVIELFG